MSTNQDLNSSPFNKLRVYGQELVIVIVFFIAVSFKATAQVANATPLDPDSTLKPALQMVFRSVLTILYMIHLSVVFRKRSFLDNPINMDNQKLCDYLPKGMWRKHPHRWTFFLTTFALPIGIFLTSEILSPGGIVSIPQGAQHVAWPRAAYAYSMGYFHNNGGSRDILHLQPVEG